MGEDTKRLIRSVRGSQEQLAEAAYSVVKTITSNADHIKLGATSLGSNEIEAQLLLLTAVKDVANALVDLIGATQSAAWRSVQDLSMEQLKTSAKVRGWEEGIEGVEVKGKKGGWEIGEEVTGKREKVREGAAKVFIMKNIAYILPPTPNFYR